MLQHVHSEASETETGVKLLPFKPKGYREVAKLLLNDLQTEPQSRIDHLTQLRNGKAFDNDLQVIIQRAKEDNEPLALAVIDIDGLKALNDHMQGGHKRGNDLLLIVARSLEHQARPLDGVYRLHGHGDEFAILLPNFTTTIDQILEEVLAAKIVQLQTGIEADINKGKFPTDISLGASIGITMLTPDDTPVSFYERADQQMYVQKRLHRLERNQAVGIDLTESLDYS